MRLVIGCAAVAAYIAACSFMEWRERQRRLPACEMTYMHQSYSLVNSSMLVSMGGYSLQMYTEATIPKGKAPGRRAVHMIAAQARAAVAWGKHWVSGLSGLSQAWHTRAGC